MFMIGNLFRESGAVPRLTSAASNEILNIATIFLMLTIGTQLSAERVFQLDTLIILGLGLVAFACGTTGGLLFAKIMNLFLKEKINPLIGSAGVFGGTGWRPASRITSASSRIHARSSYRTRWGQTWPA